MTKWTGNEHLLHKHNKSQTTADYQPTKVKLDLVKKTTAMNIKFRIGNRGKRERVMEGTSKRTTVEKIYVQLSHIYIENIIKSFYI